MGIFKVKSAKTLILRSARRAPRRTPPTLPRASRMFTRAAWTSASGNSARNRAARGRMATGGLARISRRQGSSETLAAQVPQDERFRGGATWQPIEKKLLYCHFGVCAATFSGHRPRLARYCDTGCLTIENRSPPLPRTPSRAWPLDWPSCIRPRKPRLPDRRRSGRRAGHGSFSAEKRRRKFIYRHYMDIVGWINFGATAVRIVRILFKRCMN